MGKIDLADYDEVQINVLTHNTAHFSAKFHWISTDANGIKLDLKGMYSALYILQENHWKMSFRHESFVATE